MKISVTIITYNEESNIEQSIKSVIPLADEIIVIDSFSSDQTADKANKLGAKVFKQNFMGYGQQKNFAANKAIHNWILNLDADEALSAELLNSLIILKKEEILPHSAYTMKRLNHYMGKPVFNGGWFPDKNIRFYNKSYCEWTKPHVHEELIIKEGALGHLEGNLLHYPFNSIQSQVLKNLQYGELGAKNLIDKKGFPPSLFEVIFRPLWKFIECYFLKKGFLDGVIGLIIAINAGYAMFLKYSIAYSRKIG